MSSFDQYHLRIGYAKLGLKAIILNRNLVDIACG